MNNHFLRPSRTTIKAREDERRQVTLSRGVAVSETIMLLQ